jgi:deoxyadenosine/deoxycytidine kinase
MFAPALTQARMHIAIAGNIGVGKTTLTALLAKRYGFLAHFESVDNNPYLDDFYEDMPRWSFNLQIFFLQSRFKQQLDINARGGNVVQDRTIYEDAAIFAPNLHSMGLMSTRDYENYKGLFEIMVSTIKAPDLMVYLKSSVPSLVRNIQKRGREFEEGIRLDYLKQLNERYDKWIATYTAGPLLTIEVDNLDFEHNPDDFATVFERIHGEVFGLFS